MKKYMDFLARAKTLDKRKEALSQGRFYVHSGGVAVDGFFATMHTEIDGVRFNCSKPFTPPNNKWILAVKQYLSEALSMEKEHIALNDEASKMLGYKVVLELYTDKPTFRALYREIIVHHGNYDIKSKELDWVRI